MYSGLDPSTNAAAVPSSHMLLLTDLGWEAMA